MAREIVCEGCGRYESECICPERKGKVIITQDPALNEYLTEGDAMTMLDEILKEMDLSSPHLLARIGAEFYARGRKDGEQC